MPAVVALDPPDTNTLMHVVRHWREADRHPWKRKRDLARGPCCSPWTVQRRIASTERSGIVRRVARRRPDGSTMSNEHDLTPVEKLLDAFAKEAIAQKEEQRAERDGLRREKRPGSPLSDE